MPEITDNFEGRDTEPKVYELGYLLVPFIASGDVSATVSRIFKDLVAKLGGEVTAELEPEIIRLAYTVGKLLGGKRSRFNDAYFGALKFRLDPGQILALKEGIDKNDQVLRYLLLALPKSLEKEPLKKRLLAKKEERWERSSTPTILPKEEVIAEKEEVKEEPKVEMSTEQMDEEIENLLVEKTV